MADSNDLIEMKYESNSASESEFRAPKRQRRHKFRTFSQRVADVDVDVYRNLGPKRAEPLHGASCFFQERLEAWRELNAAQDWLEVLPRLHPLCQSMPLLLHHQKDILNILLSRASMAAALSLEPFLDLTATLARDLQSDFVPHLERVLIAFGDLIDSGAEREPEILQHIFSSISLICKYLCKLLAADLLPVLKASARLRYHRAPHVRDLAAESFGYLIRHAAPLVQRAAARAVLANAIVRSTIARVHGAGTLLAAAAVGVGHGLHSRAPGLLKLLMNEELLTVQDFALKTGSLHDTNNDGRNALSDDDICARVAAVVGECLRALLQHVRRGRSIDPLWQIVSAEVDRRLDLLTTAGEHSRGLRHSAGRGLALLSSMIEFHRGSRVHEYAPLFDLSKRVIDNPHVWQREAPMDVSHPIQHDNAADADACIANDNPSHVQYSYPTLSEQALRLLQALAYSHCKAAGASQGPVVIERIAPQWAVVLAKAPLRQSLKFIRALVTPPGGADIARGFAPYMLSTVGRALLAGEETEICWPLLMDLCSCLSPREHGSNVKSLPLALTATGGIGRQLARLIHTTATEISPKATNVEGLRAAWAALSCLSYCLPSEDKLLAALYTAVVATKQVFSTASEGDVFEASLALRCAAIEALATATIFASLPTLSTVDLAELLKEVLDLVRTSPENCRVLKAAATTCHAARKGGVQGLDAANLFDIVPLVAANLRSSNASLRRATLELLCKFDQPAMLSAPGTNEVDAETSRQTACDALPLLLSVESNNLGTDAGRPSVVALGRIANYFEYSRLPEKLMPLVLRSLLGVLHIRLSVLWPAAAAALTAAMDANPAVAWPLVLEHLSTAQSAFLAGDHQARPHGTGVAEDKKDPFHYILLTDRFNAVAMQCSCGDESGSTDAAARLTHVLRALSKVNGNVIESRAKDWAPLFLRFSSAKTPDGIVLEEEQDDDEGLHAAHSWGDRKRAKMKKETTVVDLGIDGETDAQHTMIPPRAWRAAMREWLTVLRGLRGLRGVHASAALQRSVSLHILSTDTALQTAALRCLKAFKLPWLLPYVDSLLRLADNKTLRAELTAFPLAPRPTSVREDDDVRGILPEHRRDLIPLLIALLFPKMRKRSGRLGGKGAPGSARAAILNFLAGAEPEELGPLLELFLAPLSSIFFQARDADMKAPGPNEDGTINTTPPAWASSFWWGQSLGHRPGTFWLRIIDRAALHEQPLRRRIGYLNALEDLTKHLGHRIERFLPELLSLTLLLLEGVVVSTDGEGVEGAKEVRTRCLRLIAAVLERFPSAVDYNFLWPRLLATTESLLPRLAAEVAADKPPPTMELCCALASSPNLLPVLADRVALLPQVALQEGDAPEMISCTAAWASEQHLGSGLLRSCIDALASPACSEPARGAMLRALENIYELPDPLPDQVLKPHLASLLTSLRAIVLAVWRQSAVKGGGKRAMLAGVKHPAAAAAPRRTTATRALAILELVGGRASDCDTAAQLTDALLPLLRPTSSSRRRNKSDEGMIERTLAALTALWSRLASVASEGEVVEQRERLQLVAATLAPLAGSLDSRDARLALCAAFASVSLLLKELETASVLLTDLNSVSETQVDEPDYDRRLGAYRKLTPTMWRELPFPHGALPLLQHCAKDLRNAEDLSLRHAAAQALAHLVTAASETIDDMETGSKDDGTTSACVDLVQRHLFPQIKRSLGASGLAVRQEHLTLLRRLALALPDVFPDLQPLTHRDEETDFWLNSSHLQLHRRARAFVHLARLLQGGFLKDESSILSVNILVSVLHPLLQQAVLEGRAQESDAGHEVKRAEADRGANVVDAAVGALGAVARALPWVQYQEVLGRWLRFMGRYSEGPSGKAVLRAVCAVLDGFRFLNAEQQSFEAQTTSEADIPPAAAVANDEDRKRRQAEAGLRESESSDDDAHEGKNLEDNRQITTARYSLPPQEDVLRLLMRRVVPELRAQLISGESVRAPVAQALVKVLKLLPHALMRRELPHTLQTVANLLRLRLQRHRDDARTVLVAMASDLGPDYIPFFVEVLRASLPDRGFTAHVLGYTVHAILEAVVPQAGSEPGALNECLELVVPIIDADMFGDIAEAKEVDAFAASYKEAKRCRAPETFLLLASRVTFETHLTKLLAPVRARLCDASSPKIRTKLATLLQHASRGVLLNPTVTPSQLCEFVFAVAGAGLEAEEAAQNRARSTSGAATGSVTVKAGAQTRHDGRLDAEDARVALHQPLLVEFALTTFQQALKKEIIPTRGPENVERLDPLLPMLVRALKSRHSPSVTAALQALSLLVHAELPGLRTAAGEAGKAVTELLKKCPKTTHPVAQDCFKLLAGMLRRCQHYKPAPAQLRFLLQWAFTDLEESAEKQSAFALLRAILARHLVVPEVYDLMARVQELVVRSQAAQVRQLASASLLQFLLDYPLGNQRLEQHLQYLLANLAYEHESGRVAALDMLSAIVEKFPAEMISGWAETIFMPLITRLVNDQSVSCRTKAAGVARTLLRRVAAPRRDLLAQHAMTWLQGSDSRLFRAAAQVMGLVVEVDSSSARRRVSECLPLIAQILQHRSATEESVRGNSTSVVDEIENGVSLKAVPGWQETYYCLVLIEKSLTAVPDGLSWASGQSARDIWACVRHLLLHPHAWIRRIAGRLIGTALADVSIGPFMLRRWSSGAGDERCDAAGALALSFFRQLEASTDEEIASQAVKCIVYLSLPMYESDEVDGKLPKLAVETGTTKSRDASVTAYREDEDVVEQDGDEFEGDAVDEEEENGIGEAINSSTSLSGLVRRMSRLADDKSFARQLHRGMALRFIAALAARLGRDRVIPYLPVLVQPVYRVTEPGATGNPDEIKSLADEIMSHLRNLVGPEALLEAYNAAREAVRTRRIERKRREAVQVMVDPEAAARRKIRTAQRKAAGRRKAMEEVRRLRAAGVVAKNRSGPKMGNARFK